MQQSFVIKRRGFSPLDISTYVLRGYFTDNYRGRRTFRAFYGMEELQMELLIREGAEVYREHQSMDDGKFYLDREYFVCIKLPVKRNRINRLRFFECQGRERVLLFQPDEHALQKEQQILAGSIDEIHFLNEQECSGRDQEQIQGGRLAAVSGWVLSDHPFSVEIRSRGGVLLKSETESFFREDVVKNYPELFWKNPQRAKQFKCGFCTVFKAPKDGVIVTVTDGLRYKEEEFLFEEDAAVRKPQQPLTRAQWMQDLHEEQGMGAIIRHYLHMEKAFPTEQDFSAVAPPMYEEWCARMQQKKISGSKETERTDAAEQADVRPLFSIVVPLYHTKQEYLQKLIESIQRQSYSKWELCLSDGGGEASQLDGYLQRLCREDSRIHVIKSSQELGISENTNAALSIAAGDYFVFSDHDDLLYLEALEECAECIQRQPDIDLIYTDEDKISMDGTERFMPHFKPDYNRELLRSMNYFCHLVVVKRSLQKRVGVLNAAYNGAQDYDFVLRCTEQAKRICHIPKVLYHWRAHRDSTAENPQSKQYAFEAGARALNAHYQRIGIRAKAEQADVLGMYRILWEQPEQPSLISVILHGDKEQGTAVDTEKLQTVYPRMEFLYAEGTSAQALNAAAEKAEGELLLFLDRQMTVSIPEGLWQMAGFCRQKDVAAVGSRVVYSDGTIRQCGVIFAEDGGLYRAFEGTDQKDEGYFARTKCAMDVSILLKEFMMVRRSVFAELGGFDVRMQNGYHDADFCMRAKKRKLRSVYCPDVTGVLSVQVKKEDAEKERMMYVKRWKGTFEEGDPNYNPNFSARRADYSLRLQ